MALYGEHATDARRRSGAHGEHKTLKAFCPTAVERLISQTQLKNFRTILDIIAII